jgi:CRISPR/Cas system-associated exonuclease Cas4 (RecB family)
MQVLLAPYTLSEPKTLSPTAINRYMRCPLQFYYRYVADIQEPDVPDDEQELDNRIFGNIFHDAADIIYKQLPQQVTREVLDHLLRSKVEIERAVDTAFATHYSPQAHRPSSDIGGLHLINREVIIHYLRQLIQIDRRLAPFTILGLECDVERQLSFFIATPHSHGENHPFSMKIGGRIDRLDQLSDGTIRVVDYKTGGRRLKPLADVDAIFLPENIHEHSDYYLQTFVYADIVSRQQSYSTEAEASKLEAKFKVSPALLFIQHAGADDYDPVLCFGKERITDIAPYSAHFNELLEQKVTEIFSTETPFTPTCDTKICRSCPYAQLCRQT